jgi:hypothetical protein
VCVCVISEGSGACGSPFKFDEKDTVVSGVDEVGPPRPEKLWRNSQPIGGGLFKNQTNLTNP